MSTTPDAALGAVLDPAYSAVVEACAGSGKTWLLASRIVRLLLAGAMPGEILAITFTRKAAREIETRVVDWSRFLATAVDDDVEAFLAERGAPTDPLARRRARGLYERLSGASPGLAVNTFHGWFLQLVRVAPLSAGLAGATLAEEGSRRFDELWQSFATRLRRDADGVAARACLRLFEENGQAATKTMLRNGLARRAEWLMLAGEGDDALAARVEALRCEFGVVAPGEALRVFLAGDIDDRVRVCADLFQGGNKTEAALASDLSAALAYADPEARFAALRAALLTRDGGPIQRLATVSDAMRKRLGEDRAGKAVACYLALAESVRVTAMQREEESAFALNRDALTVLDAFLAHVAGFKAERRQIDFVDAEWRVLRLLGDEGDAAYLQARLDARYRHVLLDEFQDTNPLQWRILLAWLAAYSDATRPGIFLVGDPKQSIYRFRRAEPRLFATAGTFLRERFAARFETRDVTRRNAPPIIDVVNALFSDEAAFQPFRRQSSLATGLPGRVELLPLCAGGDEETVPIDVPEAASAGGLRDPLRTPAASAIDRRHADEAMRMAERLRAMLGRTLVRERHGVAEIERPLRCDDVLLLVRTRSRIAVYEQALAAVGIPFAAASRGGLLDALEVRDLVALLEFLVTPAADLPLAHALKSPLFACRDEDLLRLAARGEPGWWERLRADAASDSASPAVRRAARLLEGWLAAAAALPAHDLLDRVYHEGEVQERYRVGVPPARRAAAAANLDALLLLALDTDGGRYPSLPRFIDELKSLRRADDDDAPDEGELAGDDALAVDGRVRILTIHGAKGLEAPLVWLLDANARPRGDGPWDILVDWPPAAPVPAHLSFVGRKDQRGQARAGRFAAEAAAAEREELNLLYVAVTRAKQIFIASGIVGERAVSATPYGRLHSALARLGSAGVHGADLPEVEDSAVAEFRRAASATPPPPPVGERRTAVDAAARFGILLHALLERLTEDRDGDGWWREAGYADAELARARPVAERLLAAPGLRRFFDPLLYRRAWNELALCDADGNTLRLDRLVELEDAFWVLDYKSSGADTPRMDEYRTQVVAYCRAVAAVMAGKPVRGALLFADASLLEVFP